MEDTLPKKILRIRDLTFILPEDFDGTVEEAFTLFLEYRSRNRNNAQYSDPNGLFSSLQYLISDIGAGQRACGDGAVYVLRDNHYVLHDATNPYREEMRDKQRKKAEADKEKS